MEEQLYNILERFVINNNIKIEPEDFKLQLISNPSFPSVKSISDTLDYFGLENIVANVPKDALDQLPECFLAVMDDSPSTSVVQVQRKNNKIKIFKDDGTKGMLSIDEFKKVWNGTIVAVEKNEKPYKEPLAFLKNPLIPLAVIGGAITIYILSGLSFQAQIYTLLSLIACYLSYLIVGENLGLQNKTTSRICNSAANKTSCSAVINSTSSNLLKLLSLSDLSITFFVATVLIIGILGFNTSFFLSLVVLGLPILLYSVYAQALVIKQWCPLCLGIGTILGIQFISMIPYFGIFKIDSSYFIKGTIIFMVTYLVWIYAKGIFKQALKQEQVQADFLRFKRNDTLFVSLLKKKQLILQNNIPLGSRIIFGNSNAPLQLISITNPLCGYCVKSFEAYDSLLNTHGDKFQLSIVFNTFSQSLDQPATQIAQRIIELYHEDINESYQALKIWFADRDIEKWQKKYGIPSKEVSPNIIQKHADWCSENEINYTPATIIGRYFFPQEYDIKDLPLFIDFLIENEAIKVIDEPPVFVSI